MYNMCRPAGEQQIGSSRKGEESERPVFDPEQGVLLISSVIHLFPVLGIWLQSGSCTLEMED